jgi:2,4-dienoyl-CoA reductase-like NADH-dependent reductase (Old Yellow Enzyme family)
VDPPKARGDAKKSLRPPATLCARDEHRATLAMSTEQRESPKRVRVPLPPVRWPDAAEARASRLFSPLVVGAFTTRTRSWVPAMVPWRATEDGLVTRAVRDWYGRFADGRPGVLVAEATGIRDVPSGPLLRIGHERFVPGLAELCATVRARSAGETRFVLQIIDFLRIRRRPERARFLGEFLPLGAHHRAGLERLGHPAAGGGEAEVRAALAALPHEQLLSVLTPREAEDLEYGHRERVTDVADPAIAELPRVLPGLFARAAERARRAGFDGVELHFAHAYTMASFLSRTNTRTDGYGTTLEGRARLPLEVLAAVRAAVGPGFTVGLRYLSAEGVPGGSELEDALHFGEAFARAGVDFLSLSRGGKFDDAKQPKVGEAAYPYTGPSGLDCMPTVFVPGGPFGRNLPHARAVRARVRAAGCDTPIVACGGIHSFEQAEGALADGTCDLVGAARQSLADPDWWRKLELGHGAEIRRCLYTNYCEGLDQKHVEVTCQLWDRDFDAPDAGGAPPRRTQDGKRRLEPPPWRAGETRG